ncbi:MAG TPA: TIM barrel protein [Rhizomicrobium sp.]|jgi:sugar phosphate isomerase/epimerase|nr:TIM barrel protein [Rhizomicrobium sp.]
MMQIFASTTFLGDSRTRVTDVVRAMRNTSLDGIELGSTHRFEDEAALLAIRDLWPGRILTHNFFPPSEDENFVLNIASTDAEARARSLVQCRYCIRIAAGLGAELYTVHPGFTAVPVEAAAKNRGGYYDFRFDDVRVPHETAFAVMTDSLGELMDEAARAGVTLAIETEGSVTKQGILLMEKPEEYDRLLAALPALRLNFNLAHTSLSARVHGFSVSEFVARFGQHFAAVELSHNDGHSDQHAALVPGSYVFDWVGRLPDVPWIMEFRNASVTDLEYSAALIRAAKRGKQDDAAD